MTHTHEVFSASGHRVTVIASRNSKGVGGQIHINGEYYSDFDTIDQDAEAEARHEAQTTVDQIDGGTIVHTNAGWKFADEIEG